MRQAGDEGLRQKTPDGHGETLTLSEINSAFSPNQNNVVCLPLVSDSKRLIWVHSNQVNLQLDGAAELDKAFDRFPYLTPEQTAALAQRCSLHPDQVKVWFMAQRLRYGISWDYKDICEVQMRFKSSPGKKVLQNDGENNKWKRVAKKSGRKKAGEVREKQSVNEGRLMGENVSINQRLERKMRQEQPMKQEEETRVEEQGEVKRNTVTDRKGKKRRVDSERAGEVKITSDDVERESTKPIQTKTTLFTREKKKAKANKRSLSVQEWPAPKSIVVPDEPLDMHPPLTPLSHTQASNMPPPTDNQTAKKHRTPVKSSSAGKIDVEAKLEREVHADGCAQISCKTKTDAQLAMMRQAFLHCQYPDREDYHRLAMLIGIPRYVLVQWFGDMRYYVKKGKPRWMNQEQHSRMLANIKYQQCLNTLAKSNL